MTLCRASDVDRASKFQHACATLGATGVMADLDDGPAQTPLDAALVEKTILDTLPHRDFAAIYTHGPLGEYTRHRRHEECCRAVAALHSDGRLTARQLNLFAYEDCGRTILPRVAADADQRDVLPAAIVDRKLQVITEIYGFSVDSWEARTTPAVEGYYVHTDVAKLARFIHARTLLP